MCWSGGHRGGRCCSSEGIFSAAEGQDERLELEETALRSLLFNLCKGFNLGAAVAVGWHCKDKDCTLRGGNVHVKWFF